VVVSTGIFESAPQQVDEMHAFIHSLALLKNGAVLSLTSLDPSVFFVFLFFQFSDVGVVEHPKVDLGFTCDSFQKSVQKFSPNISKMAIDF
jgi:hypothetical protein